MYKVLRKNAPVKIICILFWEAYFYLCLFDKVAVIQVSNHGKDIEQWKRNSTLGFLDWYIGEIGGKIRASPGQL